LIQGFGAIEVLASGDEPDLIILKAIHDFLLSQAGCNMLKYEIIRS
jgi:hypothetical protein